MDSAGSTPRLCEQRSTDGDSQSRVLWGAACHCVDLTRQELMTNGARRLEGEVLVKRVAMDPRRLGHERNIAGHAREGAAASALKERRRTRTRAAAPRRAAESRGHL